MLACRIALVTALVVLAAPAFALGHHGAAHPSATPLIVELAAAGVFVLALLLRKRAAALARSSWSRAADRRSRRRVRRQARAAH